MLLQKHGEENLTKYKSPGFGVLMGKDGQLRPVSVYRLMSLEDLRERVRDVVESCGCYRIM